MAIVKELRAVDAASALAYPVTDKKNQVGDRVLFVAGFHCNPETAAADFLAVRQAYGTQGKKRKVRATYTLPEPGEAATHVRAEWPNGKGYWRAAREGEDATHVRREGVVYDYVGRGAEGATHVLRGRKFVSADAAEATHVAVEGGYEKEAEVRHWIIAYGRDEVNPDDQEAIERLAEYEIRRHEEQRPGIQAMLTLQKDGKSGNVHGHWMENATIFAHMFLDGVWYRAGQKQGGVLSDIFEVRRRYDEHRAAVSAEYGLGPNPQATSTRNPSVNRTAADRRVEKTGERSEADQIRDKIEFIMGELKPKTAEQLVQMCTQQILETKLRTVKTGRNKGRTTLTFKLPWMDQFVGPKRLGVRYDWNDTVDDKTGVVVEEGLATQLEHNAAGRPRKPLPVPVKQGAPKPVRVPTQAELDEAEQQVAALAAQERQRRALLDAQEPAAVEVPEPVVEEPAPVAPEPVVGRPVQPPVETPEDRWRRKSAETAAELAALTEMSADEEEAFMAQALSQLSFNRLPPAPAPVEQPVEVEPDDVEPEPDDVEPEPDDVEPEPASVGVTQDEPSPDSAHASSGPSTSAHAAVSETRPELAPMWERNDPNPRVQAVIEACRPWGEEARARLRAGQRLVEAEIPKGIGPGFLRKHGKGFWPEVREQLELREVKKAKKQEAWDAGRAAAIEREEYGREASKHDPINWIHDDRPKELQRLRRRHNRVHERLVAQIEAGVYEEIGRRPLQEVVGTPVTSQVEVDRELGA